MKDGVKVVKAALNVIHAASTELQAVLDDDENTKPDWRRFFAAILAGLVTTKGL